LIFAASQTCTYAHKRRKARREKKKGGGGRGGEGGGEGLEEKTEGGSYLEGDVVAVPLVATVSPPRPLLDDFGQKLRHLVLSLLPLR